jgi:S-methylmethionine-dependent homocysteine/selenocysteine methylase
VLIEEYEELIPALAEADILLCETMSSIRESEVSIPMCIATGKPTWASFTLNRIEGVLCLPDGTSIETAIKSVTA